MTEQEIKIAELAGLRRKADLRHEAGDLEGFMDLIDLTFERYAALEAVLGHAALDDKLRVAYQRILEGHV